MTTPNPIKPWPADPEKLQQAMQNPDTPPTEFDKAYLPFIWENILDTARLGFQEDGRGCVVVDYRHGEQVRVYYVSAARLAAEGQAWPEETIPALVESYHPASAVICLTFRASGFVGVYHLELEAWQPSG